MSAKIKARKMWANSGKTFMQLRLTYQGAFDAEMEERHSEADKVAYPVYVIDGSDVERLIEQIMDSMARVPQPQAEEDHVGPSWEESKARAILSDFGIKTKAKR